MMTALEKRYQVAIDKIGYERLLNLPKQIKELLQNTKYQDIQIVRAHADLWTFSVVIFVNSRNGGVSTVRRNCPTCADDGRASNK